MNREGLLATAMVCMTALVLGGMFTVVGAGDLAPPGGAVSPTMVTLDDLSGQIQTLGGSNDLGTESVTAVLGGRSTTTNEIQYTIIGSTSGSLHSIHLDHNTSVRITDNSGEIVGGLATSGYDLASVAASSDMRIIPLQVRYNGTTRVWVRRITNANQGAGFALRYTPD